MKKFLIAAVAALLAAATPCRAGEPDFPPTGTYLYAHRDTCDLFLDYYAPSGDTLTTDGIRKPTILFVFGGGFMTGTRDDKFYAPYFKALTENGYAVVSIDYRLGLKGVTDAGVKTEFIRKLDNAIDAAVSDLYSATLWLMENGGSLGIDARNLVVSGSSAGAITVLQGEWEICNGSLSSQVLPKDFNYAGVMSFSGAIFSDEGPVRYDREPCPQLLIHGTEDRLVTYRHISLFNLQFAGTDQITKVLKRAGYCYKTLRFKGYAHEIAGSMLKNLPEELMFLEENVLRKSGKTVDATVVNPEIKIVGMGKNGPKALYHK